MNNRFALPFLALCLSPLLPAQSPPGACVLEDTAFATREGGCQDQVSNLVWSARQIGSWTWSVANTWCGNLVEGGFADWRMPTLAELQAVDATGAATHLHNITVNGQPFWSATTRGNKAWGYAFGTHASTLYQKASAIYLYCVRQGLPAGSGFAGPSTLPQLRAIRVLANGTWATTVVAPDLAQLPCFFVAGLASAGGSGATILQTVPGMIDAGTGRLDAAGRTSMLVDLGALGLPATALESFWLGLVVLQPTGPVLYDVSSGR